MEDVVLQRYEMCLTNWLKMWTDPCSDLLGVETWVDILRITGSRQSGNR